MHLFYFDESGDSGRSRSPTQYFALACLIVPATQWLRLLDAFLEIRRFWKNQIGLKVTDELKASDLINSRGAWQDIGLGFNARLRIYKQLIKGLPKIKQRGFEMSSFAVVINKSMIRKPDIDPQHVAWSYALQRVERFLNDRDSIGMVLPDEGQEHLITPLLRKMRRFSRIPSAFQSSPVDRPLTNVIEDPVYRASGSNYFVQYADLLAYAAYKCIQKTKRIGPEIWNLLDDVRLKEVAKVRPKSGVPPGIVL